MMRILGTKNLLLLALVAATVTSVSGDAHAYSYGSWGSAGSYGGSYGAVSYGSGGSYGSYGRVGLRGRMVARRQARRAARASYGSYGGSYGSAGSYASYGAVSYSSYASVSYAAPTVSYGSAGSYGGSVGYGSAGITIYSSPVEYSAPVEYGAPVEAGCDCVSSISTDADMLAAGSATIEVVLPADAKVFVNEVLTTSTGSSRNYVSKGLEAGQTYAYKLRVEFEQEDKTIVKNETIKLQAGNIVALEFTTAANQLQLAAAQGPAKTELKLSVPENARVLLAGLLTQQTGAERTFTTHLLTAGQEWEGYTVRVELERDGKQLVQERTLKITGGQAYELAFDFEAADGDTNVVQVAQRN